MTLAFLKDFKKTVDKMDGVTTDFGPPKFWYSTGNLAVNKIMSGSFSRGIPQGRISCLAGPSDSGKTFQLCNILRNAQAEGAFVLVLDSENSIDTGYLKRIGMNIGPEHLQYVGVTTFNDVTKITSEFIAGYEKEYGRDNWNAPKVVLALDSLDMLLTETEVQHFEQGQQKGDQGQRAKQAKHMLRTLLSRIKRIPFAVLVTHQVYPNADLTNGQGLWIVNNAIRYSASQIMLITRGKLKDGDEIIGMRMRVETYKSRFAKFGSRTEVRVPYDEGMDPYSGFLEMMEDREVVKSAGAWKSFEDAAGNVVKFQTKDLDAALATKMLLRPEIVSEEATILQLMSDDSADVEVVEETPARRGKKGDA